MPPRTPLTIGVLGTGTTSRKNAATSVSDMIAGGRAKFILPVTDIHYSDAVRAVADFARRNDYPYEVIVDDTTDALPDVEELLEEAAKTHKVARVPRSMVTLVAKAGDKGRLVLAWDDEDTECSAAMELAVTKGLTPLDLTQGMEPLKYDDEDEESGTAEDEDLDERIVDSGPISVTAVADDPEDEEEDEEQRPETDQAPQDEPVADADEAQATFELESLHKVSFGAVGLVEAFLSEVRRIVREEVTEATKPRPRGRPRKDGQPAGSAR